MAVLPKPALSIAIGALLWTSLLFGQVQSQRRIQRRTQPAPSTEQSEFVESDAVEPARERTALIADKPAANKPAAQMQRLSERYARAALELARLNYETAVQSNRKVARSVPTTEVQRLKQLVNLAEQEVKSVTTGQINPGLKTAQANLKVAQFVLSRALEANERVPRSVSDVEIRRLTLNEELARIGLAREKAAMDSKSGFAELQWQIDELREQLSALQQRIDNISAAPQ